MTKEKYTEHLSKYGFEEVPCSIPKNTFEYIKRYIYLKILERSEKLFYFVKKTWPIKFLKERPYGDLYYAIKEDGKTVWELCIQKYGKINTLDEFSQLGITVTIGTIEEEMIPLDENLFFNLDKILQTYPELKSRYRNYLLEKLC